MQLCNTRTGASSGRQAPCATHVILRTDVSEAQLDFPRTMFVVIVRTSSLVKDLVKLERTIELLHFRQDAKPSFATSRELAAIPGGGKAVRIRHETPSLRGRSR